MTGNYKEYYNFIRDRISITRVCETLGIVAKPEGSVYKCHCIFHSDPHPSLFLYPEQNRFYCYQCGESGDIFDLIKGKLELDFDESVSWLEKNFPEILNERPARFPIRRSRDGYEIAFEQYRNMSDVEKTSLTNFAKDRGFSDTEFDRAGVFYAMGRKLAGHVESGELSLDQLKALEDKQLLIKVPRNQRDQSFDRVGDYFKTDRVVITLRNVNGKIIGFAGRAVNENEKPKYLFTKGLKKSNFLYRFDSAQNRLKRKNCNKFYLVEGFFDALRLEKRGKASAAVLGNHIMGNQAKMIAEYYDSVNEPFTIYVFMDSDEAGLKGNVDSLRNLWKYRTLTRADIRVCVIGGDSKDPDDYFKNRAKRASSYKEYSAIEYLLRYYLRTEDETLMDVNLDAAFKSRSAENRVSILHKIENLVSQENWEDIFAVQYSDVNEDDSETSTEFHEDDAVTILRNYVLGLGDNFDFEVDKKDDFSYMRTALQVARTSYLREQLTLDQWSWDRVGQSADVLFPYLQDLLNKVTPESIDVPMISIQVPKKKDAYRTKKLYIHEELLLQQYVLNVMLGRGHHYRFEQLIPAVRYQAEKGSYLTGYKYKNEIKEVVSFAYQIDMAAIDGSVSAEQGMFRPFYDCWKEYIEYVQDGIRKLPDDKVYRVKIDVEKFYDNIERGTVRDALCEPIRQSIMIDPDQWKFFGIDKDYPDKSAVRIVKWMLDELFKTEYYDSETGYTKKKDDSLKGIPQGPNLSAYVANVLLFAVDGRAKKIVDEINEGCAEGEIRARYCRYVDDMIVIAADPADLLRIKSAISSELFNLGLKVSPKTESADNISKNQALEWTVEERGGLGVSAEFDMPDDSWETMMEMCDEYDVTNRRDALKLLQSALKPVLYEIPDDDTVGKKFRAIISKIFGMEAIRINDIVRFSEYMIYEAAKAEALLEEYLQIWKRGMAYCPEDSMLQTDGIELFVFMEGCKRILNRQGKNRNDNSFRSWKPVVEKIGNLLSGGAVESLIDELCPHCELLKINRWILGLEIIELKTLCQPFVKADNSIAGRRVGVNAFETRWLWLLNKNGRYDGEKDLVNIVGDSYIQILQYIAVCLAVIDNRSQMNDLKSILRRRTELKSDMPESDLIMRSIVVWRSGDAKDDSNAVIDMDSGTVEAALRTFLSLANPNVKADTIDGIPLFKAFFACDTEDILPVYPGINYPGIMTMEKKDWASAKRFDFNYDDSNEEKMVELVPDADKWILNQDAFGDALPKTHIYMREDKNPDYKTVGLKQYLEQNLNLEELGEDAAIKAMEIIRDLYFIICDSYEKLVTEIKNPDYTAVISKENVMLHLETNGSDVIDADLGFSYLIEKDMARNAVAVDPDGTGKYKLVEINENGMRFWLAGYILEDACHVNRICYAHGSVDPIDSQMLQYAIMRLKGHFLRKDYSKKSDASYRESVKRTITSVDNYLKYEDRRRLSLEDERVINSLIRYRMSATKYDFEDCDIEVASIAKSFLKYGYEDLMECVSDLNVMGESNYYLERRSSKWYCYLAGVLESLAQKEVELKGISMMSAGIFSYAILLNLRMQTLERIQALSVDERQMMRERGNQPPLQEFGLDEDTVLTVKAADWGLVWDNLLDEKNEKRITYVTHTGWIMMLAKLYEADIDSGFIRRDNMEHHGEIKDLLREILNDIHLVAENKDAEGDSDRGEFPFDGMSRFFKKWHSDNVNKIIASMNGMDMISGIWVVRLEDEYYRQSVNSRKVHIQYKSDNLDKPGYFLTYSKPDNAISEVEHREGADYYIFTMTVHGDDKLGVSAISEVFGKQLRKWEEESDSAVSEEELTPSEELDNYIEQLKQDGFGEKLSSGETEKQSAANVGDDIIPNWPDQIQIKSWLSRAKYFANYDRIALLQMRIDSSYGDPDCENCKFATEINRAKGDSAEQLGYKNAVKSCAEFRRRKILREVFNACEKFDVDILLLPEYSVRPETVEWMQRFIENDDKYQFSVWAGTFRIPVDYQFNGSVWDETLSEKASRHAAVLPIIINKRKEPEMEILSSKEQKTKVKNPDKDVTIIAGHFKKYPSVALKEEINPYLGYQTHNFEPVISRYLKDSWRLQGAVADVTEVVCAEMFALSAICNFPSFLHESLELYNRYIGLDVADPTQKNRQRKEYGDSMLDDIKAFGEHTALYQEVSTKKRTPIILLPACTTRAADYYVWGQGFYLAAGIKTVFCNSADGAANGGSCFIGQNSWDDNKMQQNPDKLENTIYHGLKPGIYMQSYPGDDRGALGSNEQALLICDVDPLFDKTQPNAESMLSALSIVAHLPILEEDVYPKGCRDNCSRKDKKPLFDEDKISREVMTMFGEDGEIEKTDKSEKVLQLGALSLKTLPTESVLERIIKHCKSYEKVRNSSADESSDDAKEMSALLLLLGKRFGSDWLCRRGNFYQEYYKKRPWKWVPPTLVDWLYVKVDYQKFIGEKDGDDAAWIGI